MLRDLLVKCQEKNGGCRHVRTLNTMKKTPPFSRGPSVIATSCVCDTISLLHYIINMLARSGLLDV